MIGGNAFGWIYPGGLFPVVEAPAPPTPILPGSDLTSSLACSDDPNLPVYSSELVCAGVE